MPTRFLVRHALALAAFACLSVTNTHAQQVNRYFPSDATINYAINGDAIVGYANQNDFYNRTNGTSPTVNLVTGASVTDGYLGVFNSSTLNVTDGSIIGLLTDNTSTVNIFDGSINGYIDTEGTSTVNVSGGSINNLGADGYSVVNVTGGNIAYLTASAKSIVSISGGTFGPSSGATFFDDTTGVFTLIGSNLAATNARPDFYGQTDYDLSGTLQDGTNLSGNVLDVAEGRSFTLRGAAVPETSTLVALPVLLATLGAGLIRKRRRRS